MTILRIKDEISVIEMPDRGSGHIVLRIEYQGSFQETGDALHVIMEAWDQAMKNSGLDSLRAIMDHQVDGRLLQ